MSFIIAELLPVIAEAGEFLIRWFGGFIGG